MNIAVRLLCATVFLLTVPPAWAASSSTATVTGTMQLEVPNGAQAGPTFDIDVATAAYVSLLSPEEREQSAAYANGGYWVSAAAFFYGLAVAWLLLGTGLSRRMRALAERITAWKSVHTFVYAIQYIIVTTVLTFPMTVYQDFVREHQFGLATQTFSEWMSDQGKGLLVGLIIGGFAITVLYAVVRRWPNGWWRGASVTALLLLITLNTVFPVFVAPIFNRYQPLEDGPVRDSILSMARANGVPASNVYWFDASKQTTRISANVSGMLGTTRISLNDNLLNGTSLEEIEAVMAHELGHYVLNHVWEGIIYIGLIIVAGFGFVQWGFEGCRRRWGMQWGIKAVSDPTGLPLAAALFSIYFMLATPLFYAVIRSNELEADQFGLNAAGQPDGFARVAIRLSTYRKIDPSVWEETLLYHHPSGTTRVRTAMRWKKEHLPTSKP